VITGDAPDAALMTHIIAEEAPDVLILNAGARLPMKPINEQSWDEFSAAWNTDVRAGLVGIPSALNIPMKPGCRISTRPLFWTIHPASKSSVES
jgi:NADP-dependent 3-hydroxy acid dehydrogenase YdfG